MNYTEIEAKVRAATNDDAWGPTGNSALFCSKLSLVSNDSSLWCLSVYENVFLISSAQPTNRNFCSLELESCQDEGLTW